MAKVVIGRRHNLDWAMSAPLGLDNPAGGLAINQLLKLKARGVITLAQFLEMTKEVEGFEEERPIEIGNCCPVSRFLPSIRENLTQNPVPVLESCESSFS